MKKIIFILLLLAFAAYGQQQQRIAILNTEDDGEPPVGYLELAHLTAKLREVANNALPKARYGVMTQQSIVDRLGSQEQAAKACREATCLADLGKKISADYIAQARIGRFGENLTIKVELYEVRNSNLIASFAGDSKNIQGLLSVLESKSPDLFRNMPSEEIYSVDLGSEQSNFGVLNVIGAYKGWSLAINGKLYSSFENRLSPGDYNVELSHVCYDDIDFKVSISKGSNEVFDMARHVVQWKQGFLDLNAEQNGKSVSKPVYADGKRIGETPFSGYVPVCSVVEIGENREAVGVKLRYREKVKYTHNIAADALPREGARYGVRAMLGINDFSFGYEGANEGIEKGRSFGVGLMIKAPIKSWLGLNAELDLYIKELFMFTREAEKESVGEYTVSVPVLAQFMPVENISLAAGIQLDIPIESDWNIYYDYISNHRAAVDFSLVFGVGYMLTPKVGIDFKCVIGLTSLFESFEDFSGEYYNDRTSLRQYVFGAYYLF
jgi:hypothetical protein